MRKSKISSRGGRLVPAEGWAEFSRKADEAAAKRARRPKHKPTEAQLANLRPGRAHLMGRAPRCVVTARASGGRCRNAAVQGSSRCRQHGGLLDVPSHPANQPGGAAYEQAKAMIAKAEARAAFYALPADIRQQASDIWRSTQGAKRRRRNGWHHLLAIAHALRANDGGKALRAELANLQVTDI